MTKTDKLVSLGRFMISNSARFQDDALFNTWARVGQMLTEIGTAFGKELREFEREDMAVVHSAALVMGGKSPMPELLAVREPMEGRRTRRARMTRVMAKPDKERAPKAEGKKRASNKVFRVKKAIRP
jgi:hypothetical protein